MNPQIMTYDKKKPFLPILTVKSDFEGKSCKLCKIGPSLSSTPRHSYSWQKNFNIYFI